MQKRRRFKQTENLTARLQRFARDVRAEASALPPGLERDTLLKKARQAETASHIDEWINSPGLQAPD
jgi:O-succinylbenzoate synthase